MAEARWNSDRSWSRFRTGTPSARSRRARPRAWARRRHADHARARPRARDDRLVAEVDERTTRGAAAAQQPAARRPRQPVAADRRTTSCSTRRDVSALEEVYVDEEGPVLGDLDLLAPRLRRAARRDLAAPRAADPPEDERRHAGQEPARGGQAGAEARRLAGRALDGRTPCSTGRTSLTSERTPGVIPVKTASLQRLRRAQRNPLVEPVVLHDVARPSPPCRCSSPSFDSRIQPVSPPSWGFRAAVSKCSM